MGGVVPPAGATFRGVSLDRQAPRKACGAFPPGNAREKASLLARRYLTARGRRVALLERPIDVRFLPANAVVFRAGELMSFFDLVREVEDDESRRENEKKENDAKNGKAKKAPDKSGDKPNDKSGKDNKTKKDSASKKD